MEGIFRSVAGGRTIQEKGGRNKPESGLGIVVLWSSWLDLKITAEPKRPELVPEEELLAMCGTCECFERQAFLEGVGSEVAESNGLKCELARLHRLVDFIDAGFEAQSKVEFERLFCFFRLLAGEGTIQEEGRRNKSESKLEVVVLWTSWPAFKSTAELHRSGLAAEDELFVGALLEAAGMKT